MQAITPVNIHSDRSPRRSGELRMRTRVLKKKPTPTASPTLPKQAVIPKLLLPNRSRSSSPDRGPWVPPPGRSTKGQKVSWQSPRSRLELRHERIETSPSQSLSTTERQSDVKEVPTYEKRIQGVIDAIGMLKEQADPTKADQLRTEIDSSLAELEQGTRRLSTQQRSRRSSSLDEQRQRLRGKVSFQETPIVEPRRARSISPIRQSSLEMNPDREQLLIHLTHSEADITQITHQLSHIKDLLIKLKLDDQQTVSFEINRLHQHRNELLYLIEQYERSNRQLKENLRYQYHLEAENGIEHHQFDQLMTRFEKLENENQHIRRILLQRENDNIMLQSELERIRSETIGFDTMKTSLEHNRAHLQRELYTKEGEIHRLQCALKALERDLHQTRKRPNSRVLSPSPSLPQRTTEMTIERLQIELDQRNHRIDEYERKISEMKRNQTIGDPNEEILRLREQLEQAKRLAEDYKAQLQTETLKLSANNSRSHLSQVDFDEKRARLQKRFEDLEHVPTLLKQEEQKNEKLQKRIQDLEKRLAEIPKDKSDETVRTLQRKILSLEEENNRLRRSLPNKGEEKSSNGTSRTSYEFDHDPSRLRREKDDNERRLKLQINELQEKLEQCNRNFQSLQAFLNSLRTTHSMLFHDVVPPSVTRLTTT